MFDISKIYIHKLVDNYIDNLRNYINLNRNVLTEEEFQTAKTLETLLEDSRNEDKFYIFKETFLLPDLI